MAESRFQDLFENAYAGFSPHKAARRTGLKAMGDAAGIVKALGHPEFEFLEIGETAEGKGLVFFMDVRGFTKLSFVYSNEDLLRILQALLQAAVRSVAQFGGHTIEFTGDGIMATFGDSKKSPEEACLSGLHCTAFLMAGVRDVINPRLKSAGTEPVRIAIGMEFGDLLWARLGLLAASQVKPISEATFLAGKLSTAKYTEPWEAKVGENVAFWIPDEFKEKARRYEFSVDGRTYKHDLFVFKWKQFGEEFQSNAEQLKKRFFARKLSPALVTAAAVVQPDSSARSSPRPLKDQPFF
jgi:adenylate cyclase